jgi:hypothetical protein
VQIFGPNRTIDIQDQNAHIKGEYYKKLLIFNVYLLYDLSVLSSITKKGEIEEYLGPLSGFGDLMTHTLVANDLSSP